MVILTINNSELDNMRLSNVLTPIDTTMKNFDFSKVIVNKPWGYEYLAYANKNIAIWIMYIKKNFCNSMHCHLEKKTNLMLLSGKAVFSTLQEGHVIKEGDIIAIDKKSFHSTQAISDEGIFVMEIENPVNKVDLLRLSDEYGRETKGYESKNEISRNIDSYNAVFFENEEFDKAKRIGNMGLYFKKFEDDRELIEYMNSNNESINAVVEGTIISDISGEMIMPGKFFSNNHPENKNIKILEKPLILLSISRRD